MSEHLIKLTRENFDTVLAENPLVAVDFWAAWCGPCRMVAPVMEALSDRFAGRAVVGKVDVDEQPVLAERYGVMSIPTVVLFKNGQEVRRLVGAMPEQAYAAESEANL